MRQNTVTVVVAAELFVLRSAIHEILKGDPRFTSFLLPVDASLSALCHEVRADIAIVSEAVDLPDITSITLHLDPLPIEIRIRGTSVYLPYTDLKTLPDLVWLNKQPSRAVMTPRAGPTAPAREPPLGTRPRLHAEKGGS